MFKRCLDDFWEAFGRLLEDVWKTFKICLACFWEIWGKFWGGLLGGVGKLWEGKNNKTYKQAYKNITGVRRLKNISGNDILDEKPKDNIKK